MSKTARAIDFLRHKEWAAALVQLIDTRGGVKSAPDGYLFEARFAFEMSLACPNSSIQYEFRAGVGETSVDFRLDHGDMRWLIELVSLEETGAIQNLRTRSRQELTKGIFTESYVLSPDADDPFETPLAELVHVGERIEDKVWNKKRREPCKFPEPQPDQGHLLLVNMSGFEGTGDPDGYHCRELVFGSVHSGEWMSDAKTPVLGLFDPANSRPGAREVRNRIHVLAFVAERSDADDDQEIRRTAFFLANPTRDGQRFLRRFPVVTAGAERDPLYGKEGEQPGR